MSELMDKVKSTHLLPKDLINQVKKLAIDNDTNVTAIITDLLNEYVKKHKKP
jgi:hypothetical protein